MKRKLSLGVCVVISLALVAFGLLYGTISGFEEDRGRVNALLAGENGLMNALYYRGADGLNLTVVARRHLPQGDADVGALEVSAKTLRNPGGTLSEKKQADEKLSAAASQVAKSLGEAPGFLGSQRDKAYLDMLLTDMERLSNSAILGTYNEAAEEFNRQLSAPFGGALARLLRVKPCELYQ